MKYLITGGAGFIGSNYVHYHNEKYPSDGIVVLDKLTYAGTKKNLDGVLGEIEFIEGDICNKEVVEEAIDGCDVLINFAAESHVDRAIEGARTFVKTNLLGIQTLLEAAVKEEIDKFVQISTDEVYGSIEYGSFSEDDKLNPRNPYSATKAGADHLAKSYYVTHDLPVVITRSSNNYGPRQHEEKFIPTIIRNALNDEKIPVYGDGSNVRDWLYVKDNCRAIDLVTREGDGGEIYNIAGNNESQNIELVKKVLDKLNKPYSLIEFVEDRPGHDQRYSMNTSEVKKLGYTPNMDLDEGLVKTIKYFSAD